MSYQTLMVHLQLGHSNAQAEQANAAVMHAAKQIAKRCNAAVIGVMVGQQTQMIYGKGYALIDFFDREQAFLEEKIAEQVLHPPHPPSDKIIFKFGFLFFNSTILKIVALSRALLTKSVSPFK